MTALAASPLLYPIAVEPRADAVQFVRLTAADYAAASFLDGRMLAPGTPTAAVPWAEVRPAAATLSVRCHFIFHVSHVGSTLLSRLVGQHPALFSLREPAVLRFLADTHRTLDRPDCPWPRTEFDERLGKGEGAARKIDPPYRHTIASGGESSMNAQAGP